MARGDRIPFLASRTLVTVPVVLNGVEEVPLIVDSGAERMVISTGAAALLGFDLSAPVRREPLIGVGQSVAVPVVRLSQVQVGTSIVTGLLASVYDLAPVFRAEGLLGLNVLRRFRVTFEFDTRTLVLRSPPAR